MHLRNQLQHRLAMGFMACVIGILAAQGPMQNFVLCFGADGHIAVETATGPLGNCTNSPVSQTPTPGSLQYLAGQFVLGAHCGACQDIALARTDLRYTPRVSAPNQIDAKDSTGPAVVLFLPVASTNQTASGSRPDKQPATLSIPRHLRSTLLLI